MAPRNPSHSLPIGPAQWPRMASPKAAGHRHGWLGGRADQMGECVEPDRPPEKRGRVERPRTRWGLRLPPGFIAGAARRQGAKHRHAATLQRASHYIKSGYPSGILRKREFRPAARPPPRASVENSQLGLEQDLCTAPIEKYEERAKKGDGRNRHARHGLRIGRRHREGKIVARLRNGDDHPGTTVGTHN
jgi:hypothetical protein